MYLCYIVIVSSVLLFLHGFFPVTRSSKNVNNEPPTYINNISLQNHIYTSDFDKTVLIIIDALRVDFTTTQYMPLTSNIIKNNGCYNTITVETPTVTLPRIKALTAGNVPQFIDLVLNLASTEILQDSLIHSLIKKGKKVVFYGDDTWLKLFPNFFIRQEGTSSFFVRDFKEVDDNVTRNVNNELKNQDWDVMILHYLGLDHIGHVYGPFSSHIPVKLKEMDEIIHNIYSNLSKTNEKTLILVTGDHGMRDSGGHGGSSYFETHVPLLAIGLQCFNGSLFQTDIPANIAVLLGLNIPSTSIGQIRANLLPVTLEKYLFVLRYNNLLLMDKAQICDDDFLLATEFHEMYLRGLEENHASRAIDLYKNCSSAISEYLIKSSVKQNINSLVISLLIMFNSLTILITNLFIKKQNKDIFLNTKTVQYLVYLIIIFFELFLPSQVYSILSVIILILFLIKNIKSVTGIKYIYHNSWSFIKTLILINIIHPLTFFSSSFVEEEHEYWYYFFSSLLIYTALSKVISPTKSCLWLGLLSILRFIVTINSTGDKWANYPDFSDWLLEEHNYYYYQLFFIIGLVINCFTSIVLSQKYFKMCVLNLIILGCVFVLKIMDYENVLLGKLIWLLILCHAIIFYDCSKIVIWILVSSLLLKPYNLVLISYCVLTSISLFKIYDGTTAATLCHFWLGNVLYFTQGHSNSLASVDVSVGYIGLNEYQPLLVFAQVICHTYAFPVLCHMLLLQNTKINVKKVWAILFCNRLYILTITCIVTFIFRHHLFVWSVFAPKLFIESIHLIVLFIESSIYFGYQYLKRYLSKSVLVGTVLKYYNE